MTCLVRDLQSTSSFSGVNIMIFFFSVVIDAFMNFSNRLNIKLNNYYCTLEMSSLVWLLWAVQEQRTKCEITKNYVHF